jgi:hypothetical protein
VPSSRFSPRCLTGSDTGRIRSLVLYEPPLPVNAPQGGSWIGDAEAATARGDYEEAALIGLREAAGYPPEQVDRLRADPDWPARWVLALAWVREFRSVETLRLGTDRFRSVTQSTLLLLGSRSAAARHATTDPRPREHSSSSPPKDCSTSPAHQPHAKLPTCRRGGAIWKPRATARERNFAAAAQSEPETAAHLQRLADQGWTVLHDRHWPGSTRSNVDHLVIGYSGVAVIDTSQLTRESRTGVAKCVRSA